MTKRDSTLMKIPVRTGLTWNVRRPKRIVSVNATVALLTSNALANIQANTPAANTAAVVASMAAAAVNIAAALVVVVIITGTRTRAASTMIRSVVVTTAVRIITRASGPRSRSNEGITRDFSPND